MTPLQRSLLLLLPVLLLLWIGADLLSIPVWPAWFGLLLAGIAGSLLPLPPPSEPPRPGAADFGLALLLTLALSPAYLWNLDGYPHTLSSEEVLQGERVLRSLEVGSEPAGTQGAPATRSPLVRMQALSLERQGTSLQALRLPTALAGLLALTPLFLLARLYLSRWAALLATLLMALHPESLYLARSAGPSGTSIFLQAWVLWMLCWGLRSRRTLPMAGAGALLAAGLSLPSSFHGFAFLVLLWSAAELRPPGPAALLGTVLVVAWLFGSGHPMLWGGASVPSFLAGMAPLSSFLEGLAGRSVSPTVGALFPLAMGVFAPVGLVFLVRDSRHSAAERRGWAILSAASLLPLLGSTAPSISHSQIELVLLPVIFLSTTALCRLFDLSSELARPVERSALRVALALLLAFMIAGGAVSHLDRIEDSLDRLLLDEFFLPTESEARVVEGSLALGPMGPRELQESRLLFATSELGPRPLIASLDTTDAPRVDLLAPSSWPLMATVRSLFGRATFLGAPLDVEQFGQRHVRISIPAQEIHDFHGLRYRLDPPRPPAGTLERGPRSSSPRAAARRTPAVRAEGPVELWKDEVPVGGVVLPPDEGLHGPGRRFWTGWLLCGEEGLAVLKLEAPGSSGLTLALGDRALRQTEDETLEMTCYQTPGFHPLRIVQTAAVATVPAPVLYMRPPGSSRERLVGRNETVRAGSLPAALCGVRLSPTFGPAEATYLSLEDSSALQGIVDLAAEGRDGPYLAVTRERQILELRLSADGQALEASSRGTWPTTDEDQSLSSYLQWAEIAHSPSGKVYIADTSQEQLFAGTPSEEGGYDFQGLPGRGKMGYTVPLAFDGSTGHLWVGDTLTGTIRVRSPTARVPVVRPARGLVDLAAAPASPGGVYALFLAPGRIVRRTAAGSTLDRWSAPGTRPGDRLHVLGERLLLHHRVQDEKLVLSDLEGRRVAPPIPLEDVLPPALLPFQGELHPLGATRLLVVDGTGSAEGIMEVRLLGG